MTKIELCNVALAHLGEARITTIADETASARACALHYEPTRKEVLRSHRWNFAISRAVLAPAWVTLTGAAESGGEIEITKSSHGLTTGTRIAVKDVGGVSAATGSWLVTSTGVNTFTLDDSVFSGTYTSGGSYAVIPLFGWGYKFTLPTDCLRVLEVNDSEAGDWVSDEWIIEGRELLANVDAINLVFVNDIGDDALSDPLFAQAFALKLGAALSETIRGASGKAGDLLQQYEARTAPLARRVDANEGRRRKGMINLSSQFIRARFSGS